MNTISKYKYDKEVEMMLNYFTPQIKKAKTKEEADERIFWLQYMLQYVVEKYYEEKQ